MPDTEQEHIPLRGSSPSLELETDQERRQLFLRYTNLGWLAIGLISLVSLLFFPENRPELTYLALLTVPSFALVLLLNHLGKTRLAGTIFALVVNFGLFGLFLLLVTKLGADRAFANESTVWMLMGLAVLFAGAFVHRWAAPATALVDSVLLIVVRLLLAPSADIRPSALVLWWMLAFTIWLYESTLGRSMGRAWQELADRKRAEQSLFEGEQRFRSLANIERALSETEHVGLETILQLIVESARQLIPGAERAVLHLVDDQQEYLVPRAVAGFAEHSAGSLNMRIGDGIAGAAIQSRQVLLVPDVAADSRVLRGRLPPSFRSIAVAPIQSHDRCVGTISILSDRPNTFTADDGALLEALGTQAAIAIGNTSLLETTQQSLKETNALYSISQRLVASLDPDQLMSEVVELLHTDFGFYHAQIYELDAAEHMLVLSHGSGEIGARLKEQRWRLPVGSGIVGHVAETGEAITANDVDDVIFFLRNPLLPNTQSEMAVPIKVGEQVLGVLDIQQALPGRLSVRQMQLMQAVAGQLAVALQKARLYNRLQSSLRQEQSMRSQLLQNERLALVGRLLASVSHELNNPIQAIQNALFLVKEEESLSAQGRQDLDLVLAETERMSALINRLRTAYRPTRTQDFQPVQLNAVVEDVRMLAAAHMRRQNVGLDFVPGADLPIVYGIADQLRQVVLNLFMNAIEAMPSGGCLTVRSEALAENNEVRITFSDTGVGIDPEVLPRVFEPFVSSKESGTGLGLAISRDIIRQHGGILEAGNNPGGGATFSIRLPAEGKADV